MTCDKGAFPRWAQPGAELPGLSAVSALGSESVPWTEGVAKGLPDCQVWGILNVTPDSFSDGGKYLSPEGAVAQARRLLAEGAHVIDIGGASSRPAGPAYGAGAGRVPAVEELARVLPVIRALAQVRGVVMSIDTTRASVARAALAEGVRIVNDVSCAANADLLRVVAEGSAQYVLMHNRGDGSVAGDHIRYGDVVADVIDELQAGVARALAAGLGRDRIWVDPGLGFAKTADQSLCLLSATDRIVSMGYRVLVGPSRKAFIARATSFPDGLPPPGMRQGGTDCAVALAALLGAHGVRVHDVHNSLQAVRLAKAFAVARRGCR